MRTRAAIARNKGDMINKSSEETRKSKIRLAAKHEVPESSDHTLLIIVSHACVQRQADTPLVEFLRNREVFGAERVAVSPVGLLMQGNVVHAGADPPLCNPRDEFIPPDPRVG